MADILLFMQQGWENLWKQKTIWLFSAFPLFDQVVRILPLHSEAYGAWALLYLTSAILTFTSLIAVPYLAYSAAAGKMTTVQETFSAVSKFAGRSLGCFFISLLVFAPCIFLVAGLSLDKSTQPPHLSNTGIFLMLFLSSLTPLLNFTMFGFFAHDWGIWQSVKNVWIFFIDHAGVLVILGMITAIFFRAYSIACGLVTILIQSGIDPAVLSNFNYMNPFPALSNNLLFILLEGIGRIILTSFSALIFAFAYLKYSSSKEA